MDLGCGTGWETIRALKAGAYVIAIDISPKSIEFVKEQAEKHGLPDRLEACVMDAQNLTFPSGEFDIVMGNGILHHLPDLRQTMKEIRRVLTRGGYAVFVEPLGMNPVLNLYRKCTPKMRTRDEQPFRMQEINIVKRFFQKQNSFFLISVPCFLSF